ncbi:hypothetical protein [Actinoplanes sp. NPDC049681]|uniref:hypothetical protein n=1 Tax=Actinoplanes sp. NPDC049681 TaxID=3363905 RepID=UPI0037BCDF59
MPTMTSRRRGRELPAPAGAPVAASGRPSRRWRSPGWPPCRPRGAGHLPKGAATINARLPSGQVVTGAHDGDIFLIWAPGASVRGARLTAAGPDGSIVDTATAPDAAT